MREIELRTFLKKTIGLTDEPIIQELLEKATVREIPAKKVFYHEGDTSNSLMLLMEGMFATYYSNGTKREIMECLCYKPGDAAIDFSDLENRPSFSSDFKTVTNCTFVSVPYKVVGEVAPNSPEIIRFAAKQMAESSEYHQFLRRVMAMEPRKRVETIHEYYGDVLSNLTHLEIAKYLNMSRSNYEKCLSEIYKDQNK